MKTEPSGIMKTVKDGIVTVVKGGGDIAKATVDTVSNTLTTTLKDAGKVGASATEAIGDVAGGAIHGAAHVGAHLGQASKGIVIGVLHGTKHVGSAAIDTIGHTAGAERIRTGIGPYVAASAPKLPELEIIDVCGSPVLPGEDQFVLRAIKRALTRIRL